MSDVSDTHWDAVYASKPMTAVGWYEACPAKSLQLIRASAAQPQDALIDVGGGASFLVDNLLAAGYANPTVLDICAEALRKVRARLGEGGGRVTSALASGGHAIIATFGPEGPQQCSGLPVIRYAANTLAAQLGRSFSCRSLPSNRTPLGAIQQFLFCRFQRRS